MIFVDTGYLIALVEPRDSLHGRAVAWATFVLEPLVVSEYVIVEVLNHFSAQPSRKRAHTLVDVIRGDPDYRWIDAGPAVFAAGLDLHRHSADKNWSLTDCISFVLMHDSKIHSALSHDHHFTQAGFDALLRRDPP